jgi:hypothetical protein
MRFDSKFFRVIGLLVGVWGFGSVGLAVAEGQPPPVVPDPEKTAAAADSASPFGEAPPGGDAMLVPEGSAEDAAIGERIFRNGVGADGKPISAVRFGGIEVSGAEVACVNCHRRSGLGSVEGQDKVPPIAGRFLFGTDNRAVVNMNARNLKAFNVRHDAYTAETFAEAVRGGKSFAGTELGPIMPRYAFSDADLKGLTAYLRNLSKDWSPGVTRERISFATVVTPDVVGPRRQAFIDTIKATVTQRNGNVVGKDQRTMNAAEFMLHTVRAWDLDVWELQGAPETWGRQLDDHLKAQPVLALVSGLGEGIWSPVHDFCERQRVACWFPSVDAPPESADRDFYSAYFSKGVNLEAQVLGKFLKESKTPIKRLIQVHAGAAAGIAAAAVLEKSVTSDKLRVKVDTRTVKSADKTNLQQALKGVSASDAVVLWLHAGDLAGLADIKPPAGQVYFSRYLVDSDKLTLPEAWLKRSHMIYPFQLPDQRANSLAYFHAWMSMRKLPLVDEAMQSEVFFTMSFLADTLMDMLDNVHRDYMMERVESMLSQREGSKAEEEARDVNFLRPQQVGGRIADSNSRFAAAQIKRIPRLIPGAKLLDSGKKESTTVYPRLGLAVGQRFASKGAYIVGFGNGPDAKLVTNSDWIVP